MHLLPIITASLAAVSAVAAVVLPEGPNPAEVSIPSKDFFFSGSGCRPRTALATPVIENSTFNLTVNPYYAGIDYPDFQPNTVCQLKINITNPRGWQYTLDTVEYIGFASLDAKVKATLSSSYFFTDDVVVSDPRVDTTIRGPLVRDYAIQGKFEASTARWTNCENSGALNLVCVEVEEMLKALRLVLGRP
ncbi:hypothetical protein HDV05_000434 [Chytridiales sp. JEL 0842]|nr:hypothetical protein HDV05_000434 [Chytridiales sp. JEL 0842]